MAVQDNAFDILSEMMKMTVSPSSRWADEDEKDTVNADLSAIEKKSPLPPKKRTGSKSKVTMPLERLISTDNLLNNDTRASVKNELVCVEQTVRLSQISGSTATVAGYIYNVNFRCKELMPFLRTTDIVHIIHSNFMTIYHTKDLEESALMLEKVTSSKKAKKKSRKVQGTGKDFNSQITFEVKSRQFMSAKDPSKNHVYKFKVFHTGTVQLPGGLPHMIDEIVESINLIIDVLQDAFKRQQAENEASASSTPHPSIAYLNYVLKNYKFAVKIRENELLNLDILHQLCLEHKKQQVEPKLAIVSYTREETKLTLKFSTPIESNPDKLLVIKIFMRGKINILGGLRIEDTNNVYKFLDGLLKQYWRNIVCTQGVEAEAL